MNATPWQDWLMGSYMLPRQHGKLLGAGEDALYRTQVLEVYQCCGKHIVRDGVYLCTRYTCSKPPIAQKRRRITLIEIPHRSPNHPFQGVQYLPSRRCLPADTSLAGELQTPIHIILITISIPLPSPPSYLWLHIPSLSLFQ